MRGLKILVIVMGVMLVGGTAALVAAVIARVHHSGAQATPPVAAGRGFGRAVIDLPEGAHVLASEIAGERILLRVGLAEGAEELIVLDLRNGERLGTIELRPAGSPGKP